MSISWVTLSDLIFFCCTPNPKDNSLKIHAGALIHVVPLPPLKLDYYT